MFATDNIEQANRKNFKCLNGALSMPGKITTITPLFGSAFLALANVLLYNEVSYYYKGKEDMSLIKAIVNSQEKTQEKADYLFSDVIDLQLLQSAKKGDYVNPEFSATLIFACENFSAQEVVLSGPGIAKTLKTTLPCSNDFIRLLQEKNSDYPLGVEVFFLDKQNNLLGLSRTTKVEF